VLAGSALGSALGRSKAAPAGSYVGELSWVLRLGLPLVALVHVGIGSFLSMQSYFGGTFVEGTGAVVGVGLVRNVAPMMACLTLAGLLAARVTPELRAWRRARVPERGERPGFLERTAAPAAPAAPPPRPAGTPAGVVAPRLVAGAVAGLVFSLWGALVGVVVGWQVGQTMMGVSTHSFFLMFWDMLWLRDVFGLAIKGTVFGLVAATFACHEGFRGAPDDGFDAVATAACRAACFSALAILVINSGWFILVYHAGPAFGPTLLAPPAL
jgi:phospholipid/cholesterol/gamma-HCH transport system permease protein